MSFGKSDLQAHEDRVSRDDTIVNKTATATLTPAETYVVVTAAAATTITLPPVGACKHGHEIALYIVNGATHNVTIEDNAGDNVGGFTDLVIDTDLALVLIKNVAGRHWTVTSTKLAAALFPTRAELSTLS
jgi:hypothetical protein